MARQAGIIKIKGTVGDLTFYKRGSVYVAREKGGIEKGRVLTDPKFQRTRENMAEFGHAGKAGKLIRDAFRPLLSNGADTGVVSRLSSLMLKVAQADTTSLRGQRNVIDGDLTLLQGFEFNNRCNIGSTILAPFTSVIDRVTGELEVSFPAMVPADSIIAPDGATHYKIVSVGVEADFEAHTYIQDIQNSAVLPLDSATVPTMVNTHALTANSTKPLFIGLGIQFFQSVNGTNYPLKNGAGNAMTLINADIV